MRRACVGLPSRGKLLQTRELELRVPHPKRFADAAHALSPTPGKTRNALDSLGKPSHDLGFASYACAAAGHLPWATDNESTARQ
jgi:hypothetical protein